MNATETSTPLRLSRLPTTGPTPIDLVPGAAARKALAASLGLLDLRKLRLRGELIPQGRRDWRLEARLGATVVQPCSVTLAPVTTRIDQPVTRLYLEDYAAPTEGETEMPEDDSVEPLPDILDPMEILSEALALALPDFPRAEGVALEQSDFAAPGVAPLGDADVKPFAGLAGLKKKLEG